MLGRNLDDGVEASERSWSSPPSGRAEATATLADRVARLSASATGGDGTIRVRVDSGGAITQLELPDAELAAEILRTIRRAQAGLAEQVELAVNETVGPESETGRAVLESFAQRFPAVPGDEPAAPVMPSPPPFPTFQSRPSLPHQSPGNGFESGRDSRAR
ncbi:hypothetical protein [Actinoplanes sp. NPDC049265]|uniref:hypothetical protein n=1 Tax=Actinoplanes sp. NPDC049265 TaxID=3363902 RepID=UPI0037219984